MGTYTDFSIAGYPLVNSKSEVVPEVMTVFRETDKQIIKRRFGDRNPLVWGDAYSEHEEELETATLYACTTDAAIDRLNVMGFTLERSRAEYEAGRQAELEMYREWEEDETDEPWFAEKANLVKSLTFEKYLDALCQVITEGLRPEPFDDKKRPGLSSAVNYILDHNDDYLLGFFAGDVRCLIRAACEISPKPSELVQDITDLVEGGYYLPDEPVCQNAVDFLTLGHLQNFNRIVLTEGSTDAHVLRSSLKLLYPHLAAYYSFLDFDGARVPGGAGQLASLVKGFAASGVGNQIIAIFDNDSAGRDAMRPLVQLQLPPNIRILRYPDIELLSSYPTIGPSGRADLDVNGLAASIELYLGSDVLTQPDGELAPVQWKGYIQSIGSYQGEVIGKRELEAAFNRKLSSAECDVDQKSRQDWTGVEAILKAIFGAFSVEPNE